MTPPEPAASTEPLIYRVDATNRIVWVNEAWSEFARSNQGEAVMPGRVLGRDLLASLTDSSVRTLYAMMIMQARAGRPVRFDYRCDAPDRRRTFAMEIQRASGGQVEFVSTLLHEEARPAVALLQPGVARHDDEFVRVCSWCQQVALPTGEWVPVENAVVQLGLMQAERLPRITHGMCPPCEAAALKALDQSGDGAAAPAKRPRLSPGP